MSKLILHVGMTLTRVFCSHWHLLCNVRRIYFRHLGCRDAAARGRANVASAFHANGEFQLFGIREIDLLSGGL